MLDPAVFNYFFFFQAEDGIRDGHVTGVQTCALPISLVALNGKIKLHDGAFRPDELNQYLRGVTPKLSAVIRKLLAAQPEERYQDANTVRRELPRVPPGYPLTHAEDRKSTRLNSSHVA